jgi:hypothetical protein
MENRNCSCYYANLPGGSTQVTFCDSGLFSPTSILKASRASFILFRLLFPIFSYPSSPFGMRFLILYFKKAATLKFKCLSL